MFLMTLFILLVKDDHLQNGCNDMKFKVFEMITTIKLYSLKHILLAIGEQLYKHNYIKSFCKVRLVKT